MNVVAISTPHGSGGIAVIRISGPDALEIVQKAWCGKDLTEAGSHTAHLGKLIADDNSIIDQAVATIFRAPNSFTGENTVELSVHGSVWIQRQVVNRLVGLGARPAGPGEFTRRAFINRKLDLAQAEAVADVIAASSQAAHRLAMSQMSGGFSRKLNELRDSLVNLASLLELELDFSEEDVEFADRMKLRVLADDTLTLIDRLVSSYSAGRAFKEGVPVAIAGQPNAGKSTLLNALLGDEKAIVSDIPGTTRDVIEDTMEIDGILFRFFDTAGLRQTDDTIEKIGIERAYHTIDKAAIVLWLIDTNVSGSEFQCQLADVKRQIESRKNQKHILLFNKTDQVVKSHKPIFIEDDNSLKISAKTGLNIALLKSRLTQLAKEDHNPDNELIVTNARHHAALKSGADALRRARMALETNVSADFIAQDIREAVHHISEVTGQVTTDDLLGNIFANFCIGK